MAAVGIMMVLSMTTVSVIAYSSSNERHAGRATDDQVALALAEAGVNSAAAQLADADDPLDSDLFTPTPGVTCPGGAGSCFDDDYDTGSTRWYGEFDLSGPNGFPMWTITSWGVVPSPSGGPDVVRRLVAEVDVETVSTNEPNAASWNFVYSTATSDETTCDVDVTGTNVVIDVPLHIAGNLCLTGTNAKIVESEGGQPVSVTVVGKLIFGGTDSKVGESVTDPITRGAVGTGCGTSITGAVHTCDPSTDRWWVEQTDSADPVQAPVADFDTWYANAKPGASNFCTTASGVTQAQFDPDAGAARDNDAGTFNLTPTSSSYTCQYWEGGALVGELSWNKTTKVLTIAGTIYIDGSVDFGYNGDVEYNGSATLYISGMFRLTGTNSRLCANAGCDFDTWNPNEEMLMIIADGSPDAISFEGSNNKFMGSLWTNPTANVNFTGTNVEMEGPIVAGGYTWGTRVTLKPLPVITNLPPGAPLTPNVRVEPQAPRYIGS